MPHKPHASLKERQQRIFDFLQTQGVGVLSTVTPNNDPHGAVIYFTIDPDFTIHLLTKRGTQKYDNIIHNNHVMLTVFDVHTQATVQVIGIAAEQEEAGWADMNKVMDSIFAMNHQKGGGRLPPIVKLQAGAFTTFTIKPIQIRMAMYATTDPHRYGEIFDSIESFDLVDV